ncbi:hypothetical protein I6F15_27835 [Bradyrhizobium sp. BRP14]|nr:hypothetical protein [Bradyrhizobium sp. BRP14]
MTRACRAIQDSPFEGRLDNPLFAGIILAVSVLIVDRILDIAEARLIKWSPHSTQSRATWRTPTEPVGSNAGQRTKAKTEVRLAGRCCGEPIDLCRRQT